jgi:integrase
VVGFTASGHRCVDTSTVGWAVHEKKGGVNGAALGGVAGLGIAEFDVSGDIVGGEPDLAGGSRDCDASVAVDGGDRPVAAVLDHDAEVGAKSSVVAAGNHLVTNRDARRITTQIGHMRLRDVSTATLNSLYRGLGETLAPATVKNTHAVVHKALKDAVRQGILARNPAEHVELPRPEPPEANTWTADELGRFLDHVAAHRLGVAWRLVCLTGMRRSEVLGVGWRSVDLEEGRLAIVDTLVPINGKPVLRTGETKNRGCRRVIALDAGTITALREHRRRQNEVRLMAGDAWAKLDLVFTNAIGDPVNPATFTRWTKQQATQAGVPPLTPHDAARHGWATLALTAGVPPKVVQERLGHSSISITMDRYSHVIEGMDRAAAEAVAALIEHSSG